MSFMNRLKKKMGTDEPEPFDPPKDTVPEPTRKRKATAIVCSRGRGAGCHTVTLESPEAAALGLADAEALAEMVSVLSAKDTPEMPWPERQVHRAKPNSAWPPKDLAEVVAKVPELTDAELPVYPFHLTGFMRITGPAWLVSLKREVLAGAAGIGARVGSLQDDLRALARILAGGGPCVAKSGSRACRKDSGHLPPHQDGELSW